MRRQLPQCGPHGNHRVAPGTRASLPHTDASKMSAVKRAHAAGSLPRSSGEGIRRTPLVLLLALCLSGCFLGPDGEETWTDSSGAVMPAGKLRSYQAPSDHCDWGSATFLFIGRDGAVAGVPEGVNDQYVRDPEGLFRDVLADRYTTDVELPEDAVYTGLSTDTFKLWIAQSLATAVIIEVDGAFEQWPRVKGDSPVLCL